MARSIAANIKKHPVPRLSWSVDEFCSAVGISRSTYEKLKRHSLAPREMRIGWAVRISQLAVADWIAAREADAARKNVCASDESAQTRDSIRSA
ncbi:putative DNA-binding transcriptional regulator AlpA [Bradyrhizobium japonicum]|uniref:transcriptional regulator n=1 Tax=Bradyrhizobium japonicum TaxID=375 RepID=UPI00216771A6|nr:transcriptional regulator [Bradyrhizobium japonicum]MCS3496172.1 putative DNA-binding transcriptional regulator AlpA [Bradyrhizobium japonicum]MCS3961665.1 putative DNA-binding transcriptional regulator AlpA [Bradyrhizobium japonicum]MCS3993981.1 putative DNA-binding transcriptional regulator AlpA [Bradyrhizobium japonicum]